MSRLARELQRGDFIATYPQLELEVKRVGNEDPDELLEVGRALAGRKERVEGFEPHGSELHSKGGAPVREPLTERQVAEKSRVLDAEAVLLLEGDAERLLDALLDL